MMKEMKHIRILPVVSFFLAVSFGVFSQETGNFPDEAVFAPFISRFQAEVKNNLIRLSWIDSADARGPVYIYRSTRPYENLRALAGISPVEVPYGAQSFVDEPDISGTMYYFAAASDEAGQRYDILIPNNNMAAVFLPGGGDRVQTARTAEPGIFNIGAKSAGEGVVLSWNTTDGSRSAVLYRSVRPVRQTQDLLNAVIVQPGAVPPFTDYPVPGIPFYYAVIFEDELTGGTVRLLPGSNATVEAVEVQPAKPSNQAGMRAIPLPLLSVNNAVKGADASVEIQSPVPLRPETAKAVSDLKAERAPAPLKKPRAFVQDLQTPEGGEESALRAIVQGPFAGRNWEASRSELVRYLSLPRAGEPEARARFYLGQSYYFSGSYREALIEFLSVQSLYPGEANEWIQDTLSRLVN
jgi:hypothetical protein